RVPGSGRRARARARAARRAAPARRRRPRAPPRALALPRELRRHAGARAPLRDAGGSLGPLLVPPDEPLRLGALPARRERRRDRLPIDRGLAGTPAALSGLGRPRARRLLGGGRRRERRRGAGRVPPLRGRAA